MITISRQRSGYASEVNRMPGHQIRQLIVSFVALVCGSALAGCGTSSDVTTKPVLVASSINHGYRVEVAAWVEAGSLCAAWDSAPSSSRPFTALEIENDQNSYAGCAFADAHNAAYLDMANGSGDTPSDVMPVYFGPLPPSAVAVKIGAKIIRATAVSKSVFGGKIVKYWTYSPASPSEDLQFPSTNPLVPINAKGQSVPYAKAYSSP
ncbi:hypothetical protein [Rudaeicoccus suwonensis]|uniref:Uncharacterized protein n=1 Tax=Rudaeicoccus suwonensis TaxID=657409 RepID=A0A561DVF3_9MICO|nr:hypothetical protein [Rudaeicoccus suwonensis]TWE07324.1 hypothetical protein BKA23_3507 [Rudaeicoccus suwonensis]